MSSILHQFPTVDAGDDPRTVLLKTNRLPAQFKIHTGHDVSVLSETTFQQLVGITLKPTSKLLTGPSRGLLQVHAASQDSSTMAQKQWRIDIFCH